jgi:hypothetical protein
VTLSRFDMGALAATAMSLLLSSLIIIFHGPIEAPSTPVISFGGSLVTSTVTVNDPVAVNGTIRATMTIPPEECLYEHMTASESLIAPCPFY